MRSSVHPPFAPRSSPVTAVLLTTALVATALVTTAFLATASLLAEPAGARGATNPAAIGTPTARASSGTSPAPSGLAPNHVLQPGRFLRVGIYHLTMQTDGNLVATGDGWPFWQSGTAGHAGAFATVTAGGTLVVESPQGAVLWSTGAQGPGTCLLGGVDSFLPNGHLAYDEVVDTPGDSLGWWPLWSLAPCYLHHGTKVAIIGDSVTGLVSEVLPSVPTPHFAYNISAVPGFHFAQEVPNEVAVIDNPVRRARDLVVNLGTTDADHDNLSWQEGFDRVVRAAGRHCTLLVTVSTRADDLSSVQPDDVAVQINAAMRAWVAAHPNFHLLPWNALLHQGDHYQQWMTSDGVHPNATGSKVLGSLFFRYLRADCPT